MKNNFGIILALLFLGAGWTVGAQSLTVTAPNGGERWLQGGTQTIAWTYSRVSGNVRIILLDSAGSRTGLIATVPAADGRYSWTVGRLTTGTAPVGAYYVRLYAPNEDVDDRSNATFLIIAGETPPAPSIAVTVPAAGASWCTGRSYAVTWRPTGTMPASVAIDLRREGAPDSEPSAWDVADHTDNDGSFSTANVPAALPAGRYFIRVHTSGPAVTGDSGIFSVNSCLQALQPVIVAQPIGIAHTRTMAVNFHTKWKYKERHQWNCLATMGLGPGEIPPNEFKVGFFNRCADRGICADECVAQVYRASPLWDAARLRELAGKSIVKATLAIHHKGTDCNSPAWTECLGRVLFYSGLMGETDPPPCATLIIPVSPSGTYQIDVTTMMSSWLREKDPAYHGEIHNYRMEFVGVDESMEYNDRRCVSTFDNGVLEIRYRD